MVTSLASKYVHPVYFLTSVTNSSTLWGERREGEGEGKIEERGRERERETETKGERDREREKGKIRNR